MSESTYISHYRQYIASKHARALSGGGSPEEERQARGHAQRLAGMIGESEQTIISEAISS